jgi:hypothetical protein
MARNLPAAGPDQSTLPSQSAEPQLPSFRFALRHLFWFLTAVCVVLAALFAAPGPGIAPLAILLVISVVALHVAGTALGSRLRAHADEHVAWTADHANAADRFPRGIALCGPRSAWHQRGQTMPWRWWIVVAGALAGGATGVAVFIAADSFTPSPIGIAFGAVSMAVVGGWVAFVVGSFWIMLRRGWREAVDEQRKDELPRCQTPK